MPRTKRGPDGHYTEKLNNIYRSIDNYTKILAESMLYDLRQSMNERIFAAGRSARLDACDDKIYDAYIRLVRNYKEAVEQYDNMADVLVSPKIKNIMQGIQSIIYSRFQESGDLTEESAQNPIFLEKKGIINEGVACFGENFDALNERFMSEELSDIQQYARGLFVALEEIDYSEVGVKLAWYIAQKQDNAICAEVYEDYQEAVKNCMVRLNDISSRVEILRYNELLEKERGILSAIVDIQVPQLNKACSQTEEAVVGSILAPLVAAYENLERDIADIHTDAGDPKKLNTEEVPETLWNDRMIMAVLSATNYGGFAHCQKVELMEVWRSLEHDIGIVTEREIANRLYARAMYEYRKQVTSNILMADEMLRAFKRLVERTEGLELSDPIVEGIAETMRIKIESLAENRDEFAENAAEKLKSLRKDRPRIFLKELGVIEPDIDPDVRAAFFEGFRQKMNRHIAEYQDYSTKKCMMFKKENLLFEVITFEELMNYSVSRLRDQTEGGISAFVELVDGTWATLQGILDKNRITAIAPSVRDIFNGREHEVLMAEKNPDFKKGEIIKLMNCGYKQDDVVLVRANVVAAV